MHYEVECTSNVKTITLVVLNCMLLLWWRDVGTDDSDKETLPINTDAAAYMYDNAYEHLSDVIGKIQSAELNKQGLPVDFMVRNLERGALSCFTVKNTALIDLLFHLLMLY